MKTYAILVSFIVIGLALLLVNATILKDKWADTWIEQLAAVFVIGGGLGVIEKTLLLRDHFKQIRELFMVHESVTRLGLAEVVPDANHYSYSSIIRNSKDLSIVLNDGRSWLSARVFDFQHRFNQMGFQTELFVPDPGGEFVEYLQRKPPILRMSSAARLNRQKSN